MEVQQLEIADEDNEMRGSRPGQRLWSGGFRRQHYEEWNNPRYDWRIEVVVELRIEMAEYVRWLFALFALMLIIFFLPSVPSFFHSYALQRLSHFLFCLYGLWVL